MRQFTVKEIYALDRKGKHIGGIIEPVHPDYLLDSDEGPGKAYLFALARRSRELERADSLSLVVTSGSGDRAPQYVRVKVLDINTFDLDRVSSGDYWNEIPELQRFRVQAKLSEELMSRAQPEIRTSLFQTRNERYPFEGVAFAVTELDELEGLFPPE